MFKMNSWLNLLFGKNKILMKYIASLFLLFLTVLLFSSCQKELSWDISAGTLKADPAGLNCLPANVVGVYKADSTLGNLTNYIDVQVDVTSPGSYTISSDTVNGYSFRGSGDFPQLGINTARIYASGRPLQTGINTFIITYNNSQCTVDVQVTNDTSSSGIADFTLGGAGTTCTGFSLAGTYMQNLQMTSNNTAAVNISVVTPGSFSLSTATVNGVSFSASGLLSPGTTGITLTATGTPAAAGTFTYALTAGSSTCSFAVTFDPLASPAVFTFTGSPADCTGAVLNGNYASGIATNISNTLTIFANVTTIGSYSITTPVVNGMSFSGTGLFTTTGAQQVVLYANGTPSAAGAFNYDVTSGNNTCTVSVPVTGAPTDYITCKIDGVFTTFNVNATAGLSNASGPSILSIDGTASSSSVNPSINLQISKSMGGSVTPATYNVNQMATGITVTCDYFDVSSVDYFAGTDPANQNQNPAFTITVTSLTATRCVGTFTGVVKDNNGAGPGQKNITEGIFNVPVQ